MKNTFKKALILLPVLPFLMAVSTDNEVYARSYKDYELTYVREDVVGSYSYFYYTLNNKGAGYISEVKLTNEGYTSYNLNENNLFKDMVYAPGENNEVCFKIYKGLNKPEVPKSTAKGYADFDTGLTIEGTKSVTLKSKGYDYYQYKVDLSLNGERNKDYHYGVILKVTYDEQAYYIKLDDNKELCITTEEEIDITKLTVDSAVAIKSSEHSSDSYGFDLVFGVIMLIFFGLTISFGIFAAIFFPTMARRRRRRRRMQASQQ